MDQATFVPLLLAVWAIAILAMAYFWFRKVRANSRRRAAIRAMAKRRGLTLNEHRASGSTAAVVELRDDRNGTVLTASADLTRRRGDEEITTRGVALLASPEPRFPGGVALYSAPLPAGLGGVASKVFGVLDNSLARRVMGSVLPPDVADNLGQMHAITPPAGVSMSILASADPNPVVDAATVARALTMAPRAFAVDGATLILLTGSGAQIRVGREVSEADDLEALIDAGMVLRDARR